jgi:predicted permease
MNYNQAPQGYSNQGHAPQGYAGYAGHGNMAGAYVAPTGARPSAALRKWHLGLSIGAFLTFVVGFVIMFAAVGFMSSMRSGSGSSDGADVMMAVGMIAFYGAFFLGFLMIIGAAIAQVLWVYRIWNWLPHEQRCGAAGWKGHISPGAACGFFFIPYFNYYWPFVINMGLADAMNRTAGTVNMAGNISRDSALWASVLRLVFYPVGIFLQHSLMKNTDNLAEAIDVARQSGAGFNPAAYPGALDGSAMPPVGGFGG